VKDLAKRREIHIATTVSLQDTSFSSFFSLKEFIPWRELFANDGKEKKGRRDREHFGKNFIFDNLLMLSRI
jgi:hypothetical protein